MSAGLSGSAPGLARWVHFDLEEDRKRWKVRKYNITACAVLWAGVWSSEDTVFVYL